MSINLETLTKAKNSKLAVQTQYNNASIMRSLRTVTTFLIADVFDLTPEEAMWTGYHIEKAFTSLKDENCNAIPAPVMRELQTGAYGTMLADRENVIAKPIREDKDVKTATLEDWTNVFMETVITSYPDLRMLNEAKIRGYMTGLLEELGVGHKKQPRGSKYLPNTVMNLLGRKS